MKLGAHFHLCIFKSLLPNPSALYIASIQKKNLNEWMENWMEIIDYISNVKIQKDSYLILFLN